MECCCTLTLPPPPSFLSSVGSRTYLSAALPFHSKTLILSFPDGYLGDRRTAYSQQLSLDLMVRRGAGASCEMALVIVGQISRRRRSTVRFPLSCPAQPTMLQVLGLAVLRGLLQLSQRVWLCQLSLGCALSPPLLPSPLLFSGTAGARKSRHGFGLLHEASISGGHS